jgi:tetratricopeptide (TPR) repeat protein
LSQGVFRWLISCIWHVVFLIAPTIAAPCSSDHSVPDEYHQTLEQTLQSARNAAQSPTAAASDLLRLAQSYLDAGDDMYIDPGQRRGAYEAGAETARRALAMNEHNAEAHFLYAANLGNAARLGHDPRAVLALRTIKHHVARAIELNPDHARALQFMGGLLAELPWVLGGRVDEAERLLQRAIQIDSRYTNARLMLATLYLKQDKTEEAKEQLLALLNTANPHYPFHWRHKFKPEAERLLQSLERQPR